ncbi:MAG TPA: DNA primase catalytic subunit PriS [Thermoplasmatales archaeon]|nr:DNA primase catalytic subunit PriS [Thermoplasmatales archaeon]
MSFLRRKFYSYYLNPHIEFPQRFDRREYAFILFNEDTMHRHLSFSSRNDILSYLKMNIPAHAYYSSAYYRHPSAEKMMDKEWMGADLIFDLDADHLPNAGNLSYEESLKEVKEELKKLLSFLTEDFGFGERDIKLYFSGGRGYHCHVCNEKVLELGSQERREIVDYITARGLDMKKVIGEKNLPAEKFSGKFSIKTIKINPMQGGWQGRIARAIIDFFKRIKNMRREDAIKELVKIEGIGEKTAMAIYDALTDERMRRIEVGLLDQSTEFRKIAKPLVRRLAVSLHSEADEPVTADIKRLIRLPGSLHGKTGLRVTGIDRRRIDDFDPLTDAVVFGENPVKVNVLKKMEITMMENHFKIEKGEARLPEYLAVFLVARGFAEVRPP